MKSAVDLRRPVGVRQKVLRLEAMLRWGVILRPAIRMNGSFLVLISHTFEARAIRLDPAFGKSISKTAGLCCEAHARESRLFEGLDFRYVDFSLCVPESPIIRTRRVVICASGLLAPGGAGLILPLPEVFSNDSIRAKRRDACLQRSFGC